MRWTKRSNRRRPNVISDVTFTPFATMPGGLSAQRVHSLTKPTVRKRFDRRTGTFSCQTYSLHNDRGCNRRCGSRTCTLACQTDSLRNDRGCSTLEQAVWQPNAYARLPNRLFVQRSWLCDARTGGVAAEHVRSLAKPTVCATIVAVRRSNRRCDCRTR